MHCPTVIWGPLPRSCGRFSSGFSMRWQKMAVLLPLSAFSTLLPAHACNSFPKFSFIYLSLINLMPKEPYWVKINKFFKNVNFFLLFKVCFLLSSFKLCLEKWVIIRIIEIHHIYHAYIHEYVSYYTYSCIHIQNDYSIDCHLDYPHGTTNPNLDSNIKSCLEIVNSIESWTWLI